MISSFVVVEALAVEVSLPPAAETTRRSAANCSTMLGTAVEISSSNLWLNGDIL